MSSKNKKGKAKLRTVNVSADGGPNHAMTPEAAAKYLQQATIDNNNREVKISFGPSRPTGGFSFGSLDLQTLKDTAAEAQRASCSGEGLPCSEAEMKALMGMFVEIMGMNIDGTKKNGSTKDQSNPMFMLGNQPPNGTNWPDQESFAAATAGFFADGASWDALRRTYGAMYNCSTAFSKDDEEEDDDDEDDDDDDDNLSIPDLDDMRDILENRASIAPGDWESLEKVAVEDDMQAEERARKIAKKREKKQRRKHKQKEDAVAKAAEAARKKREKSILSWRSRVVSACQSGELPKLEALLQESPLSGKSAEDIDKFHVIPHLEFLLPNAIAKNRNQLERGKETRHRLASFLLSEHLPLAFIPMRSGRSPMHIACFQGDLAFVELVLLYLERYLQEHPKTTHISRENLNVTCEDSGWTALHYAAVSGSLELLEVILRSGCNVRATTDDTHTWRSSDGSGISPRELVECIKAGTHDHDIESHGIALQEMQSSFFGNESDQRSFKKILESVLRRLKDVERNGYIAPGLLEQPTSLAIQDSAAVNDDHNGQSDAAGKKKRKKKKKKKAFSKESEDSDDEGSAKAPSTTSVNTKEPTEDFEDPLVIALLGMGFAKDQIAAAVKACGGTNRATADDLVTWILGQDAEGVVVNESSHASSINSSPQDTAIEVNEKTVVKTKVAEESKPTAEQRRQSEDAAKRLAEKREEQRRRYREWNNREQERQQQQAKAKLALITDPGHRQLTAAPPTYVAPSTSSKVNISDTVIPVVRSGQIALPFKEAPLTTHRNQTVPVKKELTLSTAPLETNMTPLNATSIVTREEEFPALSQSVSTSNQENVHLVRVPPVTGTAVMTFHNSFPPIGDDERTVSSFGSNKGLSVSSASYLLPGVSPSMVMPGALFDPLSILQPGTELSVKEEAMDSVDQVTDTGQGSEIRATAKEFVPKCYASSSAAPSHLAGSMISKALPPLSANFVSGLGGPLRVSLPEGSPPFDSATIPFSQGFLGSSGPPPPVNPSYLSVGLNRYETMPTVTPLSEDTSTAATSIGSSLTGIPGLDDSTLSSGMVPLGLGLEPHPSSGNTTSLLSSVFTSGPALNVASLWGGESTLQASIPISGLPLHFTSDTSAKSEEEEKFGDKPLSFAWGGQGISGGGGQGRGSIW